MHESPAAFLLQTARNTRATGLDGLRGAAAATVAMYHFFLFFPPNRWTSLWKYSPLYALIAGHEAVLIFFVLSGYALHRMVSGASEFHYFRYVRRRVIRIYGPYLAALALAVAGNVWFAHGARPGFSDWFNRTWPAPVPLRAVVDHLLFIGNYDTDRFNGPFWSLVHEMRVSLLFPALLWLTGRRRLEWQLSLAASMMVAGTLLNPWLGEPNNAAETLHYSGLFVIGIAISERRDSLRQWFSWPVAAIALLLFYYGRGVAMFLPAQYSNGLDIPVGAGAALLVILASKATFLTGDFCQWLGRRSYSLYLVHIPVLLALVAIFNLNKPSLWMLLGYVPLVLFTAECFFRLIERPLLYFSRRSG